MPDLEELEQRALGAYLGLAVGDALGATVEFMTPREIRTHHGEHRHMVGGGWLRLRKGQITDDTEMTLALGQSILDTGRVHPPAIAEAFSAWMRTKPVDIGNTVRRGIVCYRRTGEAQVPESEHDAGNGACMRCLPIAIFTLGAAEAEVAEANRRQSHVTHNSPVADRGTLAVLMMVQAALRGEGIGAIREHAAQLVSAEPCYAFSGRRVENPSGYIVETLQAVFQVLFESDTFEGALIDVINRGGDADTTGAIAGMITGALYSQSSIPARWTAALDPEVRASCGQQATALTALSPLVRARVCF